MKILVIGLGRINVKNKDGGAIRLYQILKRFMDFGAEADVFIPQRDIPNFKAYGIRTNLTVIKDPINRSSTVVLYLYRTLKALFLVAKLRIKYDLVYCPSDFWHDTIPSFYYKILHPGCRLVTCVFLIAPPLFKDYESMYTHKIVLPKMRQTVFYLTQLITIYFGKFLTDTWLVLNRYDKDSLVKRGIEPEKVRIVSMGVDKIKLPAQSKKYSACFVGRLHPQKGINDLIAIWKKIIEKKNDATLVIIGGGSKKDIAALKKRIINNNLGSSIRYLGYMDGGAKFEIINQSRIVLVPSRYESWAQVIAEALAMDLPVVAYDLPVYRDLFSDYLQTVPVGDVDKFAKLTLSILENYDKLKNNGSGEFIKSKYNWDVVARREMDIITESV